MMKLVGQLLAFLLAAAISVSVLLWTIGLTFGSASYLEHLADQTQLYSNIAAAIPGSDATTIQNQVQTVLPGLVDHFIKNGPAPTVDFGSGSVTIGSLNPQLVNIIGILNQLGTLAPIAVLVITVIIIVVMRDRRLPTLSRGTMSAAIGLGISAGVMWLSPSVVLNSLNKPDTESIRTAITPFMTALLHGFATQIAIAAVVLLGLSLILKLIHGAGQIKAKFARPTKPSKTPPPLPPATSQNRF